MRNAALALKYFKSQRTNKVGMCLWHVQDAYDAPHLYPNAIGQWNAARNKHKGDRTPRVGAPVYYGGSKHGHIAMYVGDGKVRSTDAGGSGRMATVPLDWFERHWGLYYLGWTEDIGGRQIDFDNRPVVYQTKLKPGVDDSESVKILRRTLIKRGFLNVEKPLSMNRPGNKYTNAVVRAVKLWQKKKGHRQTGILTKDQTKQYFSVNQRIKVIV